MAAWFETFGTWSHNVAWKARLNIFCRAFNGKWGNKSFCRLWGLHKNDSYLSLLPPLLPDEIYEAVMREEDWVVGRGWYLEHVSSDEYVNVTMSVLQIVVVGTVGTILNSVLLTWSIPIERSFLKILWIMAFVITGGDYNIKLLRKHMSALDVLFNCLFICTIQYAQNHNADKVSRRYHNVGNRKLEEISNIN